MVKIAVAGANSGLALEVIDKLVEDQKHEVVALVRRDPSQFPQQPGVKWVQASFTDKTELAQHMRGCEVVLNFIVVNTDPNNTVGKLLIDAAIEAGVKRFAPSEWAMGQKLYDVIESVPWYKSKLAIQAYLREVNKEKKVLEYTLFQVGMFLEYLLTPHQVTKHVPPMATTLQFDKRRIVSIRGHENDPLTITSVADIAKVVRRAIEYEGEWPEIGGISGDRLSATQGKQLLERITGKPVELVFAEEADLEAGVLNVEMPPITHPSIPEDQRDFFYVPGWVGLLNATAKGAWTVSDEWNKLLPDLKFTTVEDAVKPIWGKN